MAGLSLENPREKSDYLFDTPIPGPYFQRSEPRSSILERANIMALVKFGGGIVAMSGSIAGNTYARNRYGATVRARTKPVNPNTPNQQRARNAIAQLSERWFTVVTAAQRLAWGVYASNVNMLNKLGESMKLSGFNHFIRSNAILMQNAFTLVDAAPVIMSLPEKDPVLAITASEATQLISIVFDDTLDWSLTDDCYMQILSGLPVQGSRLFFGGPFRFADTLDGDTAAPLSSPQTIAPGHAIAEGNALWIEARILLADGRLSEPFRAGPTVVAA